MKQDFVQKIEGYDEIVREREVCRKFGLDYAGEAGKIRSFINRLHPPRLILRVGDVIDETTSAKTLRLVSQEGYLPPFQAGQYISLVAEIGPVRTSRPYSISSPPNQRGYYDVTIRDTENGFVAPYLLSRIKVGDRIEASAPSGGFCFNPLLHDRASVFIAGGSGITPFMSMIREVVECGIDRTICLFYGNRSDADIIFHDELLRISRRFPRVTYIPVIETPSPGYSGAKGYITGKIVKAGVGETGGRTYYLCGPPAMYDFCLPELEGLSIPRHKIRREAFGPLPDITRSPGWPSRIGRDASFTIGIRGRGEIGARAGEPLLNSLERSGIVVPSLCRSGECSLCRVKLISGRIFQPAGVLLRKSDRQFGYIHSCAAYPLEDIEIML
ncbi:MAG: 2Fe-2S iron-sulfur cluster binding domain-containing protein [Deltaproteobacteria bacterium]|nr:2Fe-2S iron-sulfur cluster binding domain-containing protein [Deltaproteobacteria bacterium]